MEKQVSLSLCLFLFILSISSFLQETEALKYSYRRAPITRLVSKSLYDSIFIHKENNACPAKGFYHYEAFVEATRWFPKFGSVGGTMTRRREVAAFLAQISHETTGGWATAPDGPYAWGLCFKEEVSPQSNYCDASNTEWPCFPGKSYKGRGPIQLSWNYNYGQAGRALGFDGLRNPESVANNSVLAFKTALWFWMTEQTPKPSCHDVMVNRYRPTKADIAANRTSGFGLTTNIINGGLECGIPGDGRVNDRVGYFQRYAKLFDVNTGPYLDCENQMPFS
ncbi:Chitinase family protein [Raphanus sativus]|uniref:Chitinase 10 n=1 Tax=Raphanus sativus TaxID=3726 RepID=A0A9W3CDC5_RAPSA|nr:chitinase 10 [Raphanus sativus]KAJ4876638.1 Chitinase family protein [Raphanus sativus]